jgi:hypothetical protein
METAMLRIGWVAIWALSTAVSVPIATFNFASSPPTVSITLPSPPFVVPSALLKAMPMAVNTDLCLGYVFANSSHSNPLLFQGADAMYVTHLGFQLDLSAEADANCKPSTSSPSMLVATLATSTGTPSLLGNTVQCSLGVNTSQFSGCTLQQTYNPPLGPVAFDVSINIDSGTTEFCIALSVGVASGFVELPLPLVDYAPQSTRAATAGTSLDDGTWTSLGVASHSPIQLPLPVQDVDYRICDPVLMSMTGTFEVDQDIGPFSLQSASGTFSVGINSSQADRFTFNASLALHFAPTPLVMPWNPSTLDMMYNSTRPASGLVLPLPFATLGASSLANLTGSFTYFGLYNPANGGPCTLKLPFIADTLTLMLLDTISGLSMTDSTYSLQAIAGSAVAAKGLAVANSTFVFSSLVDDVLTSNASYRSFSGAQAPTLLLLRSLERPNDGATFGHYSYVPWHAGMSETLL